MLDQFKRLLPVTALVGALVLLIGFGLVSHFRQPLVTETGETRLVAEAALAELQALRPSSVDDPVFREALAETPRKPHLASVWLIAPDGRFVCALGGTAESTPAGRTAEELATYETRRVLSTLPDDALSQQQRTWLLAAAAIQREGEHNDIYRHLLRGMRDADGRLVGLVGLSYQASAVGVGPAYNVSLLASLTGLAMYWLSLPLWVLLDARQRWDYAMVWAIFVLIGNLVALIAYLLARSPRPRTAPASSSVSESLSGS